MLMARGARLGVCGGVEVAAHFTGEVISTSERQPSPALLLLGTLAPWLRFAANCSCRPPQVGKAALITSPPQSSRQALPRILNQRARSVRPLSS